MGTFFLQLHSLSSRVSAPDCSGRRLFFESITLFTLGMQLYESFRVLRLKIGLRAWPLVFPKGKIADEFPNFSLSIIEE